MQKLIQLRNQARTDKNFAIADAIRDALDAVGVRRILASLTRLAHYASFIFIVIGWALPVSVWCSDSPSCR